MEQSCLSVLVSRNAQASVGAQTTSPLITASTGCASQYLQGSPPSTGVAAIIKADPPLTRDQVTRTSRPLTNPEHFPKTFPNLDANTQGSHTLQQKASQQQQQETLQHNFTHPRSKWQHVAGVACPHITQYVVGHFRPHMLQ